MESFAHFLVPALLAANLTQATPLFAAEVLNRPEAAKGFSYPEIFCTNRGIRVDVEDYSCLHIDGKSFVAKCDISLNNPMWRPTGETCKSEVTSDILPVNQLTRDQ